MAKVGARRRGTGWQWYFDGAKVDGKRKQVCKGGFKTKKAALEAGTKALAEYNEAGLHFEPSEISTEDYFWYWYRQYVEQNLKKRTQDSYERIIRIHIAPKLGHYKLKALNPGVLQDVVNGIVTAGYSKAMMVNIKGVLNAALDYAVHPLGYIKGNPMRYVRSPKAIKPPRVRRVITDEEIGAILDRFPEGSGFHVPLLIGYRTGLRIGEVYGLTWDDIDLEAGTLTVCKQLVSHGGRWYLDPPKTHASNRTIAMGDTLAKALKRACTAYRAHELEYGEHFSIQYVADDRQVVQADRSIPVGLQRVRLINAKEDGSMMSSDSFKYAARVIHYELGITDFDFHSLRHTHATLLLENGANIKDVQHRLGHGNIETTLQTYAHATDKMEQETVAIFERLTAR